MTTSLSATLVAGPLIKVRIAKALDRVKITGMDMIRELPQVKKNDRYLGRKSLVFNCKAQGSQRGQRSLVVASLSSSTGILSWKKKTYLGDLLLLTSHSGKSCDLVNQLPMESYISSLLAKEMNSKWPTEALKAQAVAARSYAIYKMNTGGVSRKLGREAHYDIENSEKHQVNGTLMDTTKSTWNAAKETTGEVLLKKNGDFVPIFFHSKCGGRTLTPDQVWGNKIEGYKGVECPFCHKHGRPAWQNKMSVAKFRKYLDKALKWKQMDTKLQLEPSLLKKLLIVPNKVADHDFRYYDAGNMITLEKNYLRRVVGRKVTPSHSFKVSREGEEVVFAGLGNGHGVGMCQYGAFDLAHKGWDYKKILAYYFPGYLLKKVY